MLWPSLLAALLLIASLPARGALLAYEPFTNAPGVTITGSGGGSLLMVDLRAVPGGRLEGAGVEVGTPYNGDAPDLGAFEVP